MKVENFKLIYLTTKEAEFDLIRRRQAARGCDEHECEFKAVQVAPE